MSRPVAFITGGASGIGLAVAEHLIKTYNYKVAIADIVSERVQEQAAKLGKDHCLPLHFDVSDYAAQSQSFLRAFEWGGNRLDLVFLNAGMGDTDSLYKDMAIDEKTGLPKPMNLRTFDVNLHAVIQGIHLARHFFHEKNPEGLKGGKIVVTSSILGLYTNPAMPLYTASKHALIGLIRSLAPIYAKDSITINALCPTLIDTNLMNPKTKHLWDQEQLTPMSTALRAFDLIVMNEGDRVTGKVMELTLGEVVMKGRVGYSTKNIEWVAERNDLWESAMSWALPREPGENAAVLEED